MDTNSKLEPPSATSLILKIFNYMLKVNKTLTCWSTRQRSTVRALGCNSEKYSQIVVKGGKVFKTDGTELPADIQTSYKYLGIPQSHRNIVMKQGRQPTSKYHQRIPPKDKAGPKEPAQWVEQDPAINMYTLPIIKYPASIVSWPKEDMEAANVKTRKLLTTYWGFHSKSNT